MPLAVTLASESIFKAFEGDSAADALLHGHSYTAHPVGCQVALESLATMKRLGGARAKLRLGESMNGWANANPANPTLVWSFWSREFVEWLSKRALVADVWALGTVLAIRFKTAHGRPGYGSDAAVQIREALARGCVPPPVEDAEVEEEVERVYREMSEGREHPLGEIEEAMAATSLRIRGNRTDYAAPLRRKLENELPEDGKDEKLSHRIGDIAGPPWEKRSDLEKEALDGDGPWTVHSRTLGDVFYLMASLKSEMGDIKLIERLVRKFFLGQDQTAEIEEHEEEIIEVPDGGDDVVSDV